MHDKSLTLLFSGAYAPAIIIFVKADSNLEFGLSVMGANSTVNLVPFGEDMM